MGFTSLCKVCDTKFIFNNQQCPSPFVFSFRREHTAATTILGDLGVWRSAAIPGGLPAWELSVTFKKNLKIALLGGYEFYEIFLCAD